MGQRSGEIGISIKFAVQKERKQKSNEYPLSQPILFLHWEECIQT